MFASLHTLSALNTGHRFCTCALGNDLDATQILIKFLIEGNGTGTNAFQASHALRILLDSQSFHKRERSFV
jgi:hypothetical protein